MPTHYFTGAPSSDGFDRYLFSRATTIWIILDSNQVDAIEDQSEIGSVSQLCQCEELMFCRDLIRRSKACNPYILVDVFMHKMDGTRFKTSESRSVFQSIVLHSLMESLSDEEHSNVMMLCTSMYDYSAREGVGHMLQRVIPQISIVADLLDVLVVNCHAQQAFIIDIRTGIFVAMDTSGLDLTCYELCSDMCDIVYTSSCLTKAPGKQDSAPPGSALESCAVSMDNGYTIHLKQIDDAISLGIVMKDEAFDIQHLVDVNVRIFTGALQKSMQLYTEFATNNAVQLA